MKNTIDIVTGCYHEDVYIRLSPDMVNKLKDALDNALATGDAMFDTMNADGEEYTLIIEILKDL